MRSSLPKSEDIVLSLNLHRIARLISFIAAFIPEAVPKGFEDELAAFVLEVRKMRDYHNRFWYLLPALEAALFCLTDVPDWLEPLILNFDHHNSQLRRQTHIAAAPIAERLPFHLPDLQERVKSNLEKHHFFNDQPLAVFTVSRGDSEEKRALFQVWLDSVSRLNEQDRECLQKLINGECIDNSLFYYLQRTQQYAFLRLACFDANDGDGKPRQLTAFHPREPQLARGVVQRDPSQEPMNLFDIIDERIGAHPLMQVFLRLEKPKRPVEQKEGK